MYVNTLARIELYFLTGFWADPQIGAQFGQINNNCDQIGSNVDDQSDSNNTASASDESPNVTTTTTMSTIEKQQIPT